MKAGSLALDTSAVVLHLRKKSEQFSNRLAAATEIYIPVTALGELWFGVERSANRQRASEPLERFLSGAVIIYPDDQTAKLYAQLKAHLASQGSPIPRTTYGSQPQPKAISCPFATMTITLICWRD